MCIRDSSCSCVDLRTILLLKYELVTYSKYVKSIMRIWCGGIHPSYNFATVSIWWNRFIVKKSVKSWIISLHVLTSTGVTVIQIQPCYQCSTLQRYEMMRYSFTQKGHSSNQKSVNSLLRTIRGKTLCYIALELLACLLYTSYM